METVFAVEEEHKLPSLPFLNSFLNSAHFDRYNLEPLNFPFIKQNAVDCLAVIYIFA